MNPRGNDHVSGKKLCRFLFILLSAALVVLPVKANDAAITIPSGTILPIRLNSTISFAKSKPGQVITGRIMQDVPLSSGATIRAGSKLIGHIVEVIPAANGSQSRISFQFDKLVSSQQTISITTNLRALAGFVGVLEAQTPTTAPGEGDSIRDLTTVQVGGDVLYGETGPATTSENSEDVVGRGVYTGVLGQVRAREGTKCRGFIDGNNNPQALWVFSADACGIYRLEHLSLVHAGRTDPVGVIVLASDKSNLKLVAGAGLLLRVTGPTRSLSTSR
jgi:hypothetical protein